MNIVVKVKDTIQKPVEEVYDAIINPDKICGYFTSRVSAALAEGETVTWYFDDVDARLSVSVQKINFNRQIEFNWAASGQQTEVIILLNANNQTSTSISISESSFIADAAGIQKALQQTQGWTDFICSLKAFLYCRINLRNGRIKGSY